MNPPFPILGGYLEMEMQSVVKTMNLCRIVASQTPYRVEQFTRQRGESWNYTEYVGESEVIDIKSIGCTLLLRDIYAKLASLRIPPDIR